MDKDLTETINQNGVKEHNFYKKYESKNEMLDYTGITIDKIKNIGANALPIFYKTKKNIGIFSVCAYRIAEKSFNKDFDKAITINGYRLRTWFLFKKGIKFFSKGAYTYYFNIYNCKIDTTFLLQCPIHNIINFSFIRGEEHIKLNIIYDIFNFTKGRGRTSCLYKYDNVDAVCYFRQGKKNSLHITIRKKNKTDKFSNKCKVFFAWLLSKISPGKDIILLFEKMCSKYEESASVVYEKLIDKGFSNCYFIITSASAHVPFIKDQYKKNIIWAYSFKHFYYFFRCKKFISSEAIGHAFELRSANRFAYNKILSKDIEYIFLQHGVMYMISLDAKARGGVRKGADMPLKSKVVVSSQLEAKHFIDYAGFKEKDLLITGLPFFDKTFKNANADHILIMITWRPWEYNIIKGDLKKSAYYNMVEQVINNIPDKYLNKVWILPHPLFRDIFNKTDLNKFLPHSNLLSYDRVLQETALLITDYSSIAYSAFYRGSNVIFCWEELEKCMEQYGGHLLLNELNVFGDISLDYNDIAGLVEKNYCTEQNSLYKTRFKEIVAFNDNKNTERLVNQLQKAKFI
jgi:hypothetical protein